MVKRMLPIGFKKEWLTITIDTREQLPWEFPYPTERDTLATGDYSVKYLHRIISLERKNPSDFLGVVGGGRERFDKEIQRLLAYQARIIVIEMTEDQMKAGRWQAKPEECQIPPEERKWKSKITPAAAWGAYTGYLASGIPVKCCAGRKEAEEFAAYWLWMATRRRYDENRDLDKGIFEHLEDERGAEQ